MSIFTLTPYFTTYLVHYFYSSKTRIDGKTDIRFGISIENYTKEQKLNQIKTQKVMSNIYIRRKSKPSPQELMFM